MNCAACSVVPRSRAIAGSDGTYMFVAKIPAAVAVIKKITGGLGTDRLSVVELEMVLTYQRQSVFFTNTVDALAHLHLHRPFRGVADFLLGHRAIEAAKTHLARLHRNVGIR